jgi:hypothetical protein
VPFWRPVIANLADEPPRFLDPIASIVADCILIVPDISTVLMFKDSAKRIFFLTTRPWSECIVISKAVGLGEGKRCSAPWLSRTHHCPQGDEAIDSRRKSHTTAVVLINDMSRSACAGRSRDSDAMQPMLRRGSVCAGPRG